MGDYGRLINLEKKEEEEGALSLSISSTKKYSHACKQREKYKYIS